MTTVSGTVHGAAVTERAVIARAWQRAWSTAGLSYLTTSVDIARVPDLAADVAPGSLVVLVDGGAATGADVETLRSAGVTVLLLIPTSMSTAVRTALRAGVQGLITLADPLRVLAAAAGLLSRGESYASPTAARMLLEEHRVRARDRPEGLDVMLTGRERAVLQAMVDGLTTKATARRLGISVKTVEAHRSRLFSRLHVGSQSEAVRRALTDGRLLG